MNKKNIIKLSLLCSMAIALCFFLTSCYVEPDITFEQPNLGNQEQNFENIITPTPTNTPEPTIAPITPEPVQEATTAPEEEEVATEDPGVNLDVFNRPDSPNQTTNNTQSNNSTAVTPKPEKPTATPRPTAQVLKNGATGDRVKTLQARLKVLGYYNGKEDGKFGAGTEEALKNFQKTNGLSADGIAGNNTLRYLYSKNPKKASANTSSNKSSSSSNKTSNTNKKSSSSSSSTSSKGPILKTMPSVPQNKYFSAKGSSSGKDVRNIQNRLIDLGYLVGEADGVFGNSTEKALYAFQKANTSYADGIAGPETLEKLYSTSAKKASKPVSVVIVSGKSFKQGDTGEAVRTIQRRLIEQGYLHGSADGSFGPSTHQAVLAFQQDCGITPDGIAGMDTLNLLFTEYPDGVKNISDSPIDTNVEAVKDFTASTTGYKALSINASGTAVSDLQNKLKELGYYAGDITSTVDEDTREAILAYQRDNFLTQDGVAGPAMQRMLYATSSADKSYDALTEKSSSAGIANLQYTLYELGYYQDKISGKFNAATYNAISEFQENNSIAISGKADSSTLALMYSSFAKPSAVQTVSYETLNLGDSGDLVAGMQQRLVELGYLKNITNVFDDATRLALVTFQNYNELESNGIADVNTQIKLYDENAKKRPE